MDAFTEKKVPKSQRANFVKVLERQLQREQDEEQLSPEAAFLSVGVRILGYDIENGFVTDGPKDYGFDFLDISTDNCTIFQSKSVSYTNGIDLGLQIGPNYLDDVRQIKEVLGNLDNIPPDSNKQVSRALNALKNEISRQSLKKIAEKDDRAAPPFPVSVMLLALGEKFTPQARTEFDMLAETRIRYAGVDVLISVIPIFIDDLLEEIWSQRNDDWKDRTGVKKDRIVLHAVGDVIKDSKTAIFYAKAYDFVEAFDMLGYQIFEPNVRSEIKASKVNKAIKDTVATRAGRKDFRHLNNGITVICDGYSPRGSKDQPTAFELRKPGVVNGLQTVKSMHDAFKKLKHEDQIDFQESCLVLCRLHQPDSVRHIEDLIKATNNQNPMKPRNLKSNDPEQRAFETLFAELGWFYERKEGAWSAFASDARGWKSLGGRKPELFKTKASGYKKVDNADIAQNWLAFIGFSTEAINDKRSIFAEDHLYSLSFLRRTAKHGFDYDFKLTRETQVYTEAKEKSPDPAALVLATLLREVADHLAPTRKENRERAIANLDLGRRSRDEQDRELDADPGYQKGKMLRGMLTLFVEFVGFALFRSLGDRVHERIANLRKTPSLQAIFENLDYDPLVLAYKQRNFKSNDVVPILFAAFEHCVGALYENTSWLRGYNDAPVKNKYIYSAQTRRQLLEELLELDKRFKRAEWVRDWADGFNEKKGVFNQIASVL
ncbi:AIPR family protein [Bradyrhizobium sp. Pa8]|uniref:AIPR family protein n=1 Tax=Bradyrhizobium sp. Pa8 TaxID=3386552 RepID=UPI00403F3455